MGTRPDLSCTNSRQQDVVETTLALENFKRACDSGRGALFFSVARGKVRLGGPVLGPRQNIGPRQGPPWRPRAGGAVSFHGPARQGPPWRPIVGGGGGADYPRFWGRLSAAGQAGRRREAPGDGRQTAGVGRGADSRRHRQAAGEQPGKARATLTVAAAATDRPLPGMGVGDGRRRVLGGQVAEVIGADVCACVWVGEWVGGAGGGGNRG